MKNIRAIFYDAGMTLIYPQPVTANACLNVFNRMGLPSEPGAITRSLDGARGFVQQSLREDGQIFSADATIKRMWVGYYVTALRHLKVSEDPNLLRECAEAIYREYVELESWLPYGEVAEVLTAFKKEGYIQGVISDWGTGLRELLHKVGLTQYLDCVLVSAEVGAAKPNPHIFDLALKRAKVNPQQAVHIGDNYFTDVLGARAAGITPVFLDRGNRQESVDCSVVRNLKELMDIPPLRQQIRCIQKDLESQS